VLQQVIGNEKRRFAANLYYVMLSEVETSPRKRHCKAFIKSCHCKPPTENNQANQAVFLIVHARVPIPRKGTARLKSLVAMTVLQALNIVYVRIRQRFKSAPTAPLPRPPARHGKGGL